jgi:hypothetical protein
MLSYKLQCRIRRNFGSGESRMLLSSGLRAVVGIIPLFSGDVLRCEEKLESDNSGGFRRRTSSRKSCLIREPLVPIHPDCEVVDLPEATATPIADLPYNSIDVTPTIAIQRRSLSSRPSSDAKEYIMQDIGSEYDAPSE